MNGRLGEQSEVVRCRNVAGKLLEITLIDRSEFISPGSVLDQRHVTVNDRLFVRKYVSRAAGGRNPRYYDLLESEIRAGTRLGQFFADRYPVELACLAAYNMDVEEPFVLLRAYIGEPAANLVNQFHEPERRQFEAGLLRALHFTSTAGVVHGAVTLDAVRWDGRQFQLVDFEWAERVGEARRAGSRSPVRSPEQREGSGIVDGRDDMWAAGLLFSRLHMATSTDGLPPDIRRAPELLQALFGPVFLPNNPVERWPYPSQLLSKLRVAVPTVPPANSDAAHLMAGRQLFDQASKTKRGPDAVETVTTPGFGGHPAPQPASWLRRMFPFLATMVMVTVLIIGAVVLV